MFTCLTYPLQVISTNRIVGSSLTKEAGENLPKEFLKLYERGEMKRGLFRGFLPTLAFGFCWSETGYQTVLHYPVFCIAAGTTLFNSLQVMSTRRQIVSADAL